MSMAACVVIPIYNHKDAIGATVANLIPHGLPLFVVDDGSDEPTQAVLAALARRYAGQLTLLRLPANGGKGAAVMAGLRAARAAGFTHALQIDADGQHDTADVPRFLDAAHAKPHAVILGRPVYDASVPKSRLYGRYLTHVWVWIETLSFTIRDSMCGFRLYPLDLACDLIDGVKLPTRMDFDIEILVRLSWRRVEFVSIPTAVRYATDGVSHFDVLWDNVRISRSHTRLVAGMLMRSPLLLAHKFMPRRAAQGQGERTTPWWRMAERGSRLGMALLALGCRTIGPRLTSLWLYPIVAYFLLTGRAARGASTRYFAQLQRFRPNEPTPRPGWLTAYRHMLTFAQSGFDKLVAWSGQLDFANVKFDDAGTLDALLASGRGALVIGSHLGNLEMARALAVRSAQTRVTAIVYTEHARRFNSVLAAAHHDFAQHLVEVSDFGPETALMMQERIERGELLVIVGDRTPAREAGRTTHVPFLGASAPFAQGPYVLAHALACPVYLFFCLKERGAYRLYFESFAERIELPRRDRARHLAVWAQRYAARLEHYCCKAPYQWFNFYDFWARPSGGANGRT
ncbi:glycosyltransferase family 2 protein [Paraburkholderia kururiensis]|uniref:glycosyltransferase family 2 protein n=1 Tax=Paraburkholderia kururiensis TaxID=984307 RepID=UPI000F87E532|nr:glycosyltransferase family 2 protein [Paraburkholderia kururiensis]